MKGAQMSLDLAGRPRAGFILDRIPDRQPGRV